MNKDDIKFKYEGNDLALTLPVYVDKNRYYIPLTEIVDKIGGKMAQDNGIININSEGRTVNIVEAETCDHLYLIQVSPMPG
jgi:hypothetical protein